VLVPVQVSVYVTEPDVVGVTAWEPVAAWLPLHAPLAVQEAAWVLDHVRVADWPAVIDVGLTDKVTVGVGAGGAEDPLPPQACSARPVRAVAAADQDFCIRKLVRIGDMLPRPSGVLGAQAPEHDPRGAFPKVWNRVGDSDAEGEFTHSQTRTARVLFRDPVEFSCSSLAAEIRWHSLNWLGKRIAEGQRKSAPRTCIGRCYLKLIA